MLSTETVLFKSDKGVNGLTTAASIWAVAAIGMAAASGLYIISMATCLIMVVILTAFNPVEEWLDRMNKERTYKIVTSYQPDIISKYENLMKECKLKFSQDKRMRIEKNIHLLWQVKGSLKSHNHFIEKILKDETVAEFEF